MKKLLFLFFLISILGFSQTGDKTISNVEVRGSWYYIYDEKGKKIGSFSTNLGKLEGFGNDFIVLGKGSWYYLYDEKGKKYGSVSKSVGKIVS
ncbi:MAG: hypothetical protein LBE36_04215, partial [Flavobacteriaceae bacterium]|nr:hypothetical protein [Flavobacteriaceae bacterium]